MPKFRATSRNDCGSPCSQNGSLPRSNSTVFSVPSRRIKVTLGIGDPGVHASRFSVLGSCSGSVRSSKFEVRSSAFDVRRSSRRWAFDIPLKRAAADCRASTPAELEREHEPRTENLEARTVRYSNVLDVLAGERLADAAVHRDLGKMLRRVVQRVRPLLDDIAIRATHRVLQHLQRLVDPLQLTGQQFLLDRLEVAP